MQIDGNYYANYTGHWVLGKLPVRSTMLQRLCTKVMEEKQLAGEWKWVSQLPEQSQ